MNNQPLKINPWDIKVPELEETPMYTNTSTPKPLNEQRDGNETNLRAEPQRNPPFQLPPSGAEEHDEANQCHTHTNTHTYRLSTTNTTKRGV